MTKKQSTSTNPLEKIEAKDIFKLVVETRNFEITNFWLRSNYFLVLNTALAIGFANSKTLFLQVVMSFLGTAGSYFWINVTLGSKYWQINWEGKLSTLEDYYVREKLIPGDLHLFNEPDNDIRKRVQGELQSKWFEILRKIKNLWILRKYSVTAAMTGLAFWFLVAWVIIFLASARTAECENNKRRIFNLLTQQFSSKSIGDAICSSEKPAPAPTTQPVLNQKANIPVAEHKT